MIQENDELSHRGLLWTTEFAMRKLPDALGLARCSDAKCVFKECNPPIVIVEGLPMQQVKRFIPNKNGKNWIGTSLPLFRPFALDPNHRSDLSAVRRNQSESLKYRAIKQNVESLEVKIVVYLTILIQSP